MPSFDFEKNSDGLVVGLDEVGCGPWAGPVMAAAFCFHTYDIDNHILDCIKDSKKLSRQRRLDIFNELTKNPTPNWAFALGQVSVAEIDRLNIRQASILAMERAYVALGLIAQYVLVDGTIKPNLAVQTCSLVKGDNLSYSIAAASIIAKVSRDLYMAELAKECPYYAWETNVGYGTRLHQHGLRNHGISIHHRQSYRPVQYYRDRM